MNLIRKEFNAIFCSSNGIFFSIIYLLLSGLIHWVFVGNHNILDSGYASLSSYFQTSPLLLIVLIPALCMRSFSDERKNKTYNILLSRPVNINNIYIYKVLASWCFVTVTILATLIYPISIYALGTPIGNIDIQATCTSYASLLLITLVFCSISVFSSFLHKNQFVSFIFGLLLCAAVFYGGDLVANLFFDSNTQYFISRFGLNHHYISMQRAVIDLSDIITIINYTTLFFILFVLVSKQLYIKQIIVVCSVCIFINLIYIFTPYTRIDFTEDQRFSLSKYSKNMLEELSRSDNKIVVNIYLDGNLNTSFLRLQNAIKHIIQDLNKYAEGSIIFNFIDPIEYYQDTENAYYRMENMGMRGIMLNEKDRNGKVSQQVIFPYMQIISNQNTLTSNFLKNIVGYTAEENINSSIENLEFEFIDALRLFNKDPESIAFIEGHGEIDRTYVLDAEEVLSKYYNINRGQIESSVNDLKPFKAIIIVGSKEEFSEKDKFIIDQYIMNGGSVLWALDGVKISEQALSQTGSSAFVKNEMNLDDIFFEYGFRIEPSLIEDIQNSQILISYGDNRSSVIPWTFAPLLQPSSNNPITKNISPVKSAYTSPISFITKNGIKKNILLTSSLHSRTTVAPDIISLDPKDNNNISKNSFNESFIITGISLEGEFSSIFKNRITPKDVDPVENKLARGKPARMIVLSSSSIVKNDIAGENDQTHILPTGYDRLTNKQMGNRDLIINSVNWLVNGDEWLNLKNKSIKIRLLDKNKVYHQRLRYAIMNTTLPILFMVFVVGIFSLIRKFRYKK